MIDQAELAERSAIPFSRQNLARLLDVPQAQLNNWLSRNQLWQTHRGIKFHRSYTIRELFDLAGFAAMRDVGIPERQCAQFVRNFGFYGHFLSDGSADFSRRNGEWQIGIYNPNARITLSINLREVGAFLMTRLANLLLSDPSAFPRGAFEEFGALYQEYVAREILPRSSVEAFEASE